MGGYYVPNPNQYTQVAAYSVARDNTIPSGASIVQGIYYMWNEDGFTGRGWMHDIEGSPTNMYPDFQDDDDVAAYVAEYENLNAVFSAWSQNYTLEGWDNFYKAVGVGSGCMDVHHGQS